MTFVTGRFHRIILLNYETDPLLLAPYLPPQTELDYHYGGTYLSLLGLQSSALKVYGIPLPLYRHHTQVNLRFYVRRRVEGTKWRHGVVFISQIIPQRLIAWGVRKIFRENAVSHQIETRVEKTDRDRELVEYSWQYLQHRFFIRTVFRKDARNRVPDADRDFFVERHWGYSALRDGGCLEYSFGHPPWDTYRGREADTVAAAGNFYSPPFSGILAAGPDSAFGCSGSAISLHRGRRL